MFTFCVRDRYGDSGYERSPRNSQGSLPETGTTRNETGEQQWQRLLVQVQIAIPFKFWGSLHYKTQDVAGRQQCYMSLVLGRN